MISAAARESLQRQRNRLVVERNRLYDAEARISAASRILMRAPEDPADELIWDGIFQVSEAIHLRIDSAQERIDRIDQLKGADA